MMTLLNLLIMFMLNACINPVNHLISKIMVQTIFNQCPFSGGKAVFEARAMVDYFNDTIVYDDDANCLAQGYTMKQYKPLIENSFVVKPIPNPATTSVTFTYTPELFETGLLTITDNLSRKVVVRTINGKGTINVDLQGFNPGIYYYKITGAKYCETGKLIVF